VRATSIVAEVRSLVRAEWQLKFARGLLLTVCFCAPYFALQRVRLFPMRTMPMTLVDRAIAFEPGWAWVYQSGYLLIVGVPWLLSTTDDIGRYVRGFISISYIGFICFLLLPITGPRPDVWPSTGMFALLAMYDRPSNELPSLHVGLLTYTMLVGATVSRTRIPSAQCIWMLAIAGVWATGVTYAALATKQHYALDIPAGALVGWVGFRHGWRRDAVAQIASQRIWKPHG
jgi:PAP2 superfamily protein